MKGSLPHIVILSAELACLSAEENRLRMRGLAADLTARDVSWRQVEGYYQGAKEAAVICQVGNAAGLVGAHEIALYRGLAFGHYGQESILERHPDGSCYLLYADQPDEYIGQWFRVSRADARTRDAYTYDPATDTYWAACK